MLRINKILILCVLSALSFSAFALKDDSTKPIQIEADNATADQKNMVTVFTGNVVVTRGSIIVHANQATASQDAGGNKTVHVTGNPVTFEQTNDDGEKTQGQCNDFVYSTKTDVAILTGRARVKKGDNEVMGDKLTYNTKTQVYSASSANANGVNSTKSGRVTVILQPNQKGQSNDQF
ncbi:MAG: lipopolysaccharide transport periplasmic protein LptA [Neisseriaceae bacterium]|jgi:lipopolysaccharide export system protein LptA|nr:MAG: lipopolysaccharide transport periplasmic protein LptA [Neisseriaceae bacterium]